MKGLKIIPMFLVLMVLTYVGMLFVEANHDEVVISFGTTFQSAPIPLGFVVLTSVLAGMVVCGFLCSVELLALYMQNRQLRRRLALLEGRLAPEKVKTKSAKTAAREPAAAPVPPTDVITGS
jgi:uncharacterized integral membrane protein